MKPWILNVGIMSQIPLALPTSCSKKPVEMEKFRSWYQVPGTYMLF